MLPLRDENPHPTWFKPKLTILLIIINVIVFFFEWGAVPTCITGSSYITQPGIQIPCPDMPYVSLLSSMFLHGGLMHLGGNMLFLWIFGDNIEFKFGRAKFLGIYLFWGIVAGLAHIVIDPLSSTPAVGASGAISGVLGAYLILSPRS